MTAPVLTLAAAATATGLSQSTLRRKRAEMLAAGARQTAKGAWEIPVPVLIQLGLMPAVTAPDSPPVERVEASVVASTQAPSDSLTAQHRDELEALRKELQEYRERAVVAEAVLKVKEELIEVQRMALRQLEMAPQQTQVRAEREQPAPVDLAPEPVVEQSAPVLGKRRWWQR